MADPSPGGELNRSRQAAPAFDSSPEGAARSPAPGTKVTSRTVLISGAGIAGPTLAYWLLHHGFEPTLLERAPAPRTGGYMIDLWGVGYDVAEGMGLLSQFLRDGYRVREVRLVNGSGKRVAGFDADVLRAVSEGRFLSLLRGDLAGRLYQLVADRVETIFGDSIASLEQDADGVTVSFEHAPARRFDLVVGADGLRSRVRNLVFPEARERYLGYYAAAFCAQGYPRRDVGAYVSYSVPERQVARYALRDGRSAFFFIFAQDQPLAIEDHDSTTQRDVLWRRFVGAGWESREILMAMTREDDLYFDAVAQIQLSSWSRGRVALVGDAAYGPSLLAGQGAALAMAGACTLAHALGESAGDHAVAFARYERRFKPFADAKQRRAERLGWWFAPRTRLGVELRNVLTRLMSLPEVARLVLAPSPGDRYQLSQGLLADVTQVAGRAAKPARPEAEREGVKAGLGSRPSAGR
jgi:2-polyprenyl-6-methoxyphenol hydroxylase-like FAD-dependent oxidoreductase